MNWKEWRAVLSVIEMHNTIKLSKRVINELDRRGVHSPYNLKELNIALRQIILKDIEDIKLMGLEDKLKEKLLLEINK